MIKVWTDAAEAGLLDRQRDRGSAFAYLPETVPQRAVSVTMPVRLPSWDVPFGLPPIFEMNLPEGALRERLPVAAGCHSRLSCCSQSPSPFRGMRSGRPFLRG